MRGRAVDFTTRVAIVEAREEERRGERSLPRRTVLVLRWDGVDAPEEQDEVVPDEVKKALVSSR